MSRLFEDSGEQMGADHQVLPTVRRLSGHGVDEVNGIKDDLGLLAPNAL